MAAPGPGPDQGAHVGPAQVQPLAGERGDGRPGLGVGGLQPDRGPDPVRQQGLAADEGAVADRQMAAVQGVGLDRVDGRLGAVFQPGPGGDAQHQAAQRDGQGPPRGDHALGAEPLVHVDGEQQHLQAVGQLGLQHRQGPGARSDQGGHGDQPQLAGPDPPPQPA
jgi:hypothetical protein